MTETLIQQYINPKPELNIPIYGAFGMENRLRRFGLWCLRHKRLPFATQGISLRAAAGQAPEEALPEEAFEPTGPLYSRPMNFYVKLGNGHLINCGYLAQHFICSERQGYQGLVDLLATQVKGE